MPRFNSLDLSFPRIPVSDKETPFSLEPLLYQGGASIDRRYAQRAIEEGLLGGVVSDRRELVRLCHESITMKMVGGGSVETARSEIKSLKSFFMYAENRPGGGELSLAGVQEEFLEWTEWLRHRHLVAKELSASTIYATARRVAGMLDYALGRPTPLIELARIREPKPNRGARLEQQDLEATFSFGHLLQDVCDGLTLRALEGPRPLQIRRQTGELLTLWAGLHSSRADISTRSAIHVSRYEEREARYLEDRSSQGRVVLINTRIEAEMLMFIGQTGMNLGQVINLRLHHFCYSSDIDGYRVRDYKSRRRGEVLFEIFREYRVNFERYLKWRKTLFPDSSLLFPFIRRGRREDARPPFSNVQRACADAGVPWITPAKLRNTRVNWLLRRSGDQEVVAEMAQSTKETLLKWYEKPSHQRAIVEVTRFWGQADPLIRNRAQTPSTAPGVCDGRPEAAKVPKSVPSPDCIRPSGCLWCDHHRDIDSMDYVWALSSFRHLKILESSTQCPAADSLSVAQPSDHAIERLSTKLSWFRESNAQRRSWVQESLARIEEGYYHPDWLRLVASMEGTTA